jgi:Tc5 transposase DNA-binding domain
MYSQYSNRVFSCGSFKGLDSQYRVNIFNTRLNRDPNFKASSGWVEKFKGRHGIKELEIHGKKFSAVIYSPNTFIDTLKVFVEEEGYDEESIYIYI